MMVRKKILLMFLTILPLVADAQVEIDGIFYHLDQQSNTAEVATGNGKYASYETVVIPNSVTYEGIQYDVTSISDGAFLNCKNLVSVTIGNHVVSIGRQAFRLCSSLTSIVIPGSVSSIGDYAFRKCSSLTSLTLHHGLSEVGNSVFRECSSLKSVSIPNSLTEIGGFMFSDCPSLTSVTIPHGVKTIGELAFHGCSGLTSITIPNSVTTIGDGVFSGCSGLTSIIIPSGVTSIAESTFSGCRSLTSVAIPNSVNKIGKDAFMSCSALTSVVIPNGVSSIEDYTFDGCSSLTSITIPNSITNIGMSAFGSCAGLTSIALPNSVTSIGQSAFGNCSNLAAVNIPNSITSIEDYTFYGCSSLSFIEIPKSVSSIGSQAFEYCHKLKYVLCHATEVPNSENNAFLYYKNWVTTLYVPYGCKDAYASVEPWMSFKEIVEITSDGELFPDCPTGEIRYAALYLYLKGIVQGEHGLLLAEREATRAEVAKTSFYGAYFGPSNVPTELSVDNYPSVYEDLQDKGTYYYRPAKALLYLEYGDGITPFDRNRLKFEPEEKIQRVNVLKVLMEAFNIKPDIEGTDNPFPNDEWVVDMAARHPRRMGYVRRAAELGIITKDNDEFHPYKNCTRGQAFLMLARIMQKIEAGEIDNPSPWENSYFQPLNTTLKTIGLGASLQMGNFRHYTKTSFDLSGVMPLTFAHAYNSYNTTLPSVFFGGKTVNQVEETYQPLGEGWSHNYHSFITIVADKEEGGDEKVMKLIVHWGGGSIDVYKAEDGKLVPESMGIYDDLSLDGNDVVIMSRTQTEYRFSKQGSTGANVLYLYRIKDRNGNTLTLNYDDGENGSKRISSVSDGQRYLYFAYLPGTDLLSEVRDPLNRSVGFTYFDNKQTGRKQLESFTDAEGHTTTYEYADQTTAGASKLLSRIRLPKGNYIENEYDDNRRLCQTVSGIDNVPTARTIVSVGTDFSGDKASTLSTVYVERSTGSIPYYYVFNENNVMTSMTGVNNMYVNSNYDDPDHPELATTIQNNHTDSNITYDKKGNVTSITENYMFTTTMTYDEKNNLTSVTDPMNNTTYYSYDDNGNLTGVSAPEDVTYTMTEYDRGLPKETQDPLGVRTRYDYNEFGNLTAITFPALGLSSTAVYDAASRRTKSTDALGRTRSFDYNNNDLLTSEKDAMNHTTSYDYDANGNLTRITNAKGGVTTMSYASATDKLQSVEFANAKKVYDYNDDGTLNNIKKPDGTTLNYSYDVLGRIISDGKNSYSYDGRMRLSEISDGSKSISFAYDYSNRITGTVCDGANHTYGYDDNGNCTYVNNTGYTYDGLNRMTSVSFYDRTIRYTYRKDSQLSKVEYPNGMITTFGYDKVGRLTSKQTALADGTVVAGYAYVLDEVGNIMEQTAQEPFDEMVVADEAVSYSYNDGNRITKAGDICFEFDANGNTTMRGDETYTWNVKDQLTNAGSTAITYNPLGQIASYGDITFTTDPLGIGRVLSDSRSGAEYIYGDGLEARVVDGRVSYYVTDFRGSVVAIVDEDGNITHRYQYDDFGKVLQKEEADYNPFQYVGKYGVMYLNDHLYYMRARHYDPTIGRFLSEDPVWSTNLYPYVENNPIMGIDPKGTLLEATSGYYSGVLRETSDWIDVSGTGSNTWSLQLDQEIPDSWPEEVKEIVRTIKEASKFKYLDGFFYFHDGKRLHDPSVWWGGISPRSYGVTISKAARQTLINNSRSNPDKRFVYDPWADIGIDYYDYNKIENKSFKK